MQIIVLGAHRSGTSALTRLINMTGAYTGGEGSSIGFNEENPKGFWERQDVVDVNDALLSRFGCSWDSLHDWHFDAPESFDRQSIGELNDSIKAVLLELDQHRPWVTKDPRLCQTFGFWRNHLEIPVAVVAWRDPMEVAISLNKRNGFSMLHGLALWEHAMVGALNASIGIPRLLVSYQDMMRDPVALTQRVHDWLGTSGVKGIRMPSEQEVKAFIDPSLYRSKAAKGDQSSLLNASQLELLAYLQRGELDDRIWRLSGGAKETFALVSEHHRQAAEKEEFHHLSEQQAERIRELEAQVKSYEERPWAPEKPEWNSVLERLDHLEDKINQEANSLRTLKRFFRALPSWLGG